MVVMSLKHFLQLPLSELVHCKTPEEENKERGYCNACCKEEISVMVNTKEKKKHFHQGDITRINEILLQTQKRRNLFRKIKKTIERDKRA